MQLLHKINKNLTTGVNSETITITPFLQVLNIMKLMHQGFG